MGAKAFEHVIFLREEAQFVQNTIYFVSVNRAVGDETDQGAVVPFTAVELAMANSILAKVRGQIGQPEGKKVPIVFTDKEAQMMVGLYIRYVQGHGKPQGDLD